MTHDFMIIDQTNWKAFTRDRTDHQFSAVLRYVIYFRFCGWRHVTHNGPYGTSCLFLSGESIYHTGRNYFINSNQSLLDDEDSGCSSWVAHRGGERWGRSPLSVD